MALTRTQIETYLREVGVELELHGLIGEILLTGGAFITLVLRSRNSTKDVDAVPISDAAPLRAAAGECGEAAFVAVGLAQRRGEKRGSFSSSPRWNSMGGISRTPSGCRPGIENMFPNESLFGPSRGFQ